jgi:hypothetical protein
MPIVVLLVAFVVMLPIPAHADLNDDFAACRRNILQIGSNPSSPADQYCLGLSHAFALNHKKDRAEAADQNNSDGLLVRASKTQATSFHTLRNPTSLTRTTPKPNAFLHPSTTILTPLQSL